MSTAGKKHSAPTAAECKTAERMIRAAFPREPEVDDLIQEVLEEAWRKWDGRAKFSSYAVRLAGHRAKDLAATRAREEPTKDLDLDEPKASPWSERREARLPPAQIARAVARLVDTGGGTVGMILLDQREPARGIAAFLRLEIGRIVAMRIGRVRLSNCVGPIAVPANFVDELARFIRTLSGSRRRGRPSRDEATRIVVRVGSRPDDLRPIDVGRRHEVGKAIVRKALALVGIDGRALNRITRSVARARTEKYDRLKPLARAALAEIQKPSR